MIYFYFWFTYLANFFLTAQYYSIVWIDHMLFVHSSADGHLGCYHFLTFRKNAATDIRSYERCCVDVCFHSLRIHDFFLQRKHFLKCFLQIFYFHRSDIGLFEILMSCSTAVIICPFSYIHPCKREVVFHLLSVYSDNFLTF